MQVGGSCYTLSFQSSLIKTFMLMLTDGSPVSLTCMQVPMIKVGRVYYGLLTINYI